MCCPRHHSGAWALLHIEILVAIPPLSLPICCFLLPKHEGLQWGQSVSLKKIYAILFLLAWKRHFISFRLLQLAQLEPASTLYIPPSYAFLVNVVPHFSKQCSQFFVSGTR